jgi:hypothetical protein
MSFKPYTLQHYPRGGQGHTKSFAVTQEKAIFYLRPGSRLIRGSPFGLRDSIPMGLRHFSNFNRLTHNIKKKSGVSLLIVMGWELYSDIGL